MEVVPGIYINFRICYCHLTTTKFCKSLYLHPCLQMSFFGGLWPAMDGLYSVRSGYWLSALGRSRIDNLENVLLCGS